MSSSEIRLVILLRISTFVLEFPSSSLTKDVSAEVNSIVDNIGPSTSFANVILLPTIMTEKRAEAVKTLSAGLGAQGGG